MKRVIMHPKEKPLNNAFGFKRKNQMAKKISYHRAEGPNSQQFVTYEWAQ
jgi:hypothetical protein